jgi:hypothetical protein
MLAHLAYAPNELDDAFLLAHLATIEKSISKAKNRVRHAMNGALIAIGLRNDALQKQAITAAGRIGKVVVDHGDTGCKTPEAIPYIQKAAQRKRS